MTTISSHTGTFAGQTVKILTATPPGTPAGLFVWLDGDGMGILTRHTAVRDAIAQAAVDAGYVFLGPVSPYVDPDSGVPQWWADDTTLPEDILRPLIDAAAAEHGTHVIRFGGYSGGTVALCSGLLNDPWASRYVVSAVLIGGGSTSGAITTPAAWRADVVLDFVVGADDVAGATSPSWWSALKYATAAQAAFTKAGYTATLRTVPGCDHEGYAFADDVRAHLAQFHATSEEDIMPITTTERDAEVTAWYTPILGTFVDVDKRYDAQCKDLISDYIMKPPHSEPYTYGDGNAMADNLITQRGWARGDTIQPGDVVSIKPNHVYVALSPVGDDGTLRYVDQNGGPLPAGQGGVGGDEAVKVRTGAPGDVIAIARPPRYVNATEPVIERQSAPAATEDKTHAVKKGDTFWGISRAYDVKLEDLRTLNPGVDPNRLHVGQVVVIAAGTRVTYMETAAPANVRRTPSKDQDPLGQLPAKTPWYATGNTSGGWVEGRSPYMTAKGVAAGWISGELLSKGA